MPNSRIPSPARSQGPPVTPRRYKKRATRSVGSPARSTTSGRLSNIVEQFKENNRDENQESFGASPLSKTVLSDNTEIEMPRRQSWWRKVNNSRDVTEVLANEKPSNPANVLDEFEVEVLTQEKKNYSIDLPESSDNESIHSLVVPQRKLFTIKENAPQKKFGDVVGTSKENKTQIEDKTIHVATKNLFSKTSQRPKPVFPSALLNITAEKTLENKTKEAIEMPEAKARPKSLFDRPGTKRKNFFPDLLASESEDSIPEIIPKRFTFHKPSDPSRRSSNASSITTDIDMDDWKLLPSSTMVEHQLEAQLTTPGKRARLSKLSEGKESTNPNSTQQTNKSISSKNKSKVTPTKDVDTEKLPAASPNKDVNQTTTQKHNTSQNKSKTFNKTKNMSQAPDIGTVVDEEGKEASQVKNKTYNVSQTIDKHMAKNQKDNQENIEDVQIADKTDLTQIQNASQNKSKTFNKTKNLSLAQDLPPVANEHAQETSQVKNKTYNINQTINKQASKSQEIDDENIEEVQQADKNEQNIKEIVETDKMQEDEEDINLTYEDNDPEEMQENNDKETHEIDNKTKTICVDNRLSKVSEYMDNIEIELSRIVGEEQNQVVLQMETPMPNKSVHLTKKVIAETPESKLDGRRSQNVETSTNKSPESQIVDQKELGSLNKENEITKTQVVGETQENEQIVDQENNLEQPEDGDKSDKAIDDNNEEKEASDGEIEVSDQDQAEASQMIEDSGQEGTDAGQELEADEDDQEPSQDDEEIEAQEENETEELEASQEVENNGEVAEEEPNASENVQEDEDQDAEVDDIVIDESQNNEDDQNESEEIGDQNASHEVDEEQIENEEEQNERQVTEDQNESQDVDEQQNETHEVEEDHNKSQEIEEDQNESQEVDEDQHESEEEDEEQNESQEVEEEQIESEQEQNESEEVVHEEEEEEQNESQEIVEEEEEISQEIENNDELNESQEPEEEDQEMDVIEASEEMEEDEMEPQQSTSKTEANISHDTTGRNRKRATNTPEAILHDNTNEIDSSIIAKGRNTSIRKTLLKNFTIRPSMAPARESTRLSDGTKNSSAEGSGWDSHRTTRKTLRQTFGKDFTPRKSLRALVMEKSAKRQTQINEANELLRHQANSTEIPDEDQMDYEDNIEQESDHEVSRRTKQTTLEAYLQKVKQENMEFNKKIEQQVRDSVKSNPRMNWNFQNNKPTIQRMKPKVTIAPKIQRQKRSVINIENLPPELVEDMKYRPPKRFRPANASWITKRLYKFLETKLEPKYDYKARVRAEKLVETIYNFVRDSKRLRTAQPHAIAELKREMARLDITKTHFEFYNFFHEYLPREVIIKVVPDIANDMAVPTDIFAPIIV